MKTAILIIIALVSPVVVIAFWVLKKSAHQGEDNNPSESDSETQGDTQGTGTTVPSSDDSSDSTDGASPHVSQEPHEEYEPKFVIGDRITNGTDTYTIQDVKPNGYLLEGQPPLYLPFTEEDKWELAQDSPDVSPQDDDRFRSIFDGMVAYLRDVIDLEKTTTTYGVLLGTWADCYAQATFECDDDYNERFYIPENFPQITPTEGSNVNSLVLEQMCAMMFYQVLAEVMPDKRQQLAEMTMNYTCDNRTQPLYGWLFYSDPSYARMMAAIIATTTHRQDAVDAMRKELGTTMIEYKGDISELWLDLTKFMPPAPGPYLDAYKNRPNGTPGGDVLSNGDLSEDASVEFEVAENYSLKTNRKEFRQRTIQAVANKECKVQHLFSKNRTVTDPNYGEMTFTPVFGKDTIGIEIPDNGAIANLVYTVGVACSNSRKPLLTAEYGRRRPGQGYYDPSSIMPPDYKALVNYAIEDGDGHRTGFYNQGGDYVDDQGNHIGDYETYYQSQLYANSYPSGHSAYIAGVTLALMEVMPDKTSPLMMAMGWFRLSRCITRYHHLSDTTIGLLCGMLFLPIVRACKNIGMAGLLDLAKVEYQRLISGDPAPSPEPTEKVNTSLSWVLGGYGSCHVDAGEPQMGHCCTKEANKDRYPAIMVSQTVKFKIEGAGVSTIDGKTDGIFEAGAQYVLMCPAVTDGKDRTATITLRNDNGVRKIYYTLSLRGTHDDGPAER